MKILKLSILLILSIASLPAAAARIKDIANVRGVRDNQLIGYGIVVGLKGTGDSKNSPTNLCFDFLIKLE
jgi:flagellar P-ring protein precursor FlgI